MTRYSSRRDPWLVVLLMLEALALLCGSVVLLRADVAAGARVLLMVLCLTTAVFIGLALAGTCYLLSPEALVVRVGPLRWRVPLNAIREVIPERNFVSSAALSVHRLRVRYGATRWDIYISPADQRAFLEELATLAPQLERHGSSLVKRASP